MDRITEELWRDRLPPFDGLTLATPTLTTAELRAAAAQLVGALRASCGGARLSTAEDWHEHDGFVTEPMAATWDDLEGAVASEEALQRWSPEDTYVRRAWHADGSFYLRWFFYDEGDSPFAATPPAGGDLDLTAGRDVIRDALEALRRAGVEAEVEPAAEFFGRRLNE